MNSLIILPEEREGAGLAVLRDQRAAEVLKLHDLRAGIEIRASELGGNRGLARVQFASTEKIVLELKLDQDPLPRAPTDLIVAVPRPQTVKKILQLAAMCGVTGVHFVRSRGVEKSYLNSKALLPSNIQREILIGLQQGGDSIPPCVTIQKRFKPFVEDVLPELLTAKGTPLKWVADTGPGAQSASRCHWSSKEQGAILAIGPESGWSKYEIDCLGRLGFQQVSLGIRQLRVEVAAAFLLAQLQLLQYGVGREGR